MSNWLVWVPQLRKSLEKARLAEQVGFDGMMLFDSPVLAPDEITQLSLIAAATETLGIGICTTNLVTRHPAVLASTAMTLHAESGGRMVLGVGRGDSAVASLGLRPQQVTEFQQAVAMVRQLVAGQPARSGDREVRLEWLPDEVSPVPVWGVGSGPKVIAAGASVADGQVVQVGADPSVVSYAARLARESAGNPDLRVAAYVVIAVDRDPSKATARVQGMALTASRMSVALLAQMEHPDAQLAAQLAQSYSLGTHGRTLSGLPDGARELVGRYAIAGDVDTCVERLRELKAAGVDDLILLPGSLDTDDAEVLATIETIGTEILPAI